MLEKDHVSATGLLVRSVWMQIIQRISSFFFHLLVGAAAPPPFAMFVAFGMAGGSSKQNNRSKLSYVALGLGWVPNFGASASKCMERGDCLDLGTRLPNWTGRRMCS